MKKIFLIVAMLVMFVGCSSKPSESIIKEQFVASLNKNGMDGLFEIEEFKKINGLEEGDNKYIVDVEYILLFKKSLETMSNELKNSKGNFLESAQKGIVLTSLGLKYGNFKAGEKTNKLQQKLVFVKTENGWQLSDNGSK